VSEAEKVNKTLELMGSAYRASPGSLVSESMEALFEALPAYIDRQIERKLAEPPISPRYLTKDAP